jgi:UDP-2,4-diacetamido-2,4,6-trideoxy-beta-L-altropyranose hydrolase
MQVVFRTDASKLLGTGHVMRCLNLAASLRQKNAICRFICRSHEGHLLETISARGFESLPLPTGVNGHDSNGDATELGLLGATSAMDAEQTARAIGDKVDWMVVDHYAITADWEKVIRGKAVRLLVIDDLANRQHDCDVILDQNWYGDSTQTRYDSIVSPRCLKLLGPAYALLGHEYSAMRQFPIHRTGDIARVLIFMGGSDMENHTATAVQGLMSQDLRHLDLTVVLGQNHPDKTGIQTMADQRGNTTVLTNVPGLAQLMRESDLMLGAGGISNWERICLGLPAVVMSVAQNQVEVNLSLAESGFINYLGESIGVTEKHIADAVRFCLENPELMRHQSSMMMDLVPGSGAEVVAGTMEQMTLDAATPTH